MRKIGNNPFFSERLNLIGRQPKRSGRLGCFGESTACSDKAVLRISSNETRYLIGRLLKKRRRHLV